MRDNIVELLNTLNSSLDWVRAFTAFIESNDTQLLSAEAGIYKAEDLLAEIEIRFKSTGKAGINTIGMTELIDTLRSYSGDEIILNYIFKSEQQTGIAYLVKKSKKLIGAVLVDHS